MIGQLFFELIQVSLGTQICLSNTPTADEWGKLYDMAKKQSLVGVCFAGVQKTLSNSPLKGEDPSVVGMPEILYLTWMGMAAKIQQRNDVVNRQCVELQARLSADGLRCCILKGQGIATLYGNGLRLLRQSGDIDVWVDADIRQVLPYLNNQFGSVEFDYVNAHAPYFDDTEVEVHWRAAQMFSLLKNAKFQKWVKKNKVELLSSTTSLTGGDVTNVPSSSFNMFYVLLHIYNHMFTEGVGLRQVMDFYFVLKNRQRDCDQAIVDLYCKFGLLKFASAMMWVLKEVFGLKENDMLLKPNKKEGEFLLSEIMVNGNFGHHDDRVKNLTSHNKLNTVLRKVQHNSRLFCHYPADVLSAMIWVVYHYFWKRFFVINLKSNNK